MEPAARQAALSPSLPSTVTIPWEQRDLAIASGFDPDSVTERSARRRTGDAGLGRPVVVPVYLRRALSGGWQEPSGGVQVRLSPGGGLSPSQPLLPLDVPDLPRLWLAVHRASDNPLAVSSREGWTQVLLDTEATTDGAGLGIVLRSSDWALLRTALALRNARPSDPQDAPVEQVSARFLGRLDGVDGTPGAGLWGRLALEVVGRRRLERLADTRSLRWYACWGVGGFPAGSAGRESGSGGAPMLLDLTHQEVRVRGRLFRVRTLPDWEREQAAHDLGLPPRRVMAWPVSPLAVILVSFAETAPAPLDDGPQDAR